MSGTLKASRRFEKGSAVLFIVAWIVFAILALGAWALFEGQAGIGRMQAQFQADAVSAGAGVATRVYGPELVCDEGYGFEFLEALHARNGGEDVFACPLLGFSPVAADPTLSVGLVRQEEQRVRGQFGGLMSYEGTARRDADVTALHQYDTDEFVKDRQNFVLMLDFSKSMARPVVEGDKSKIVRLRNIITHVLSDLPLRPQLAGENVLWHENVDLGVVFFGGSILESIPIQPGEQVKDAIINRVNGPLADDTNPLEGGTNYAQAFQAAAQLFNDLNDGDLNFTILITDGEPTKNLAGNFQTPFIAGRDAYANFLEPLVGRAWVVFVGDPDNTEPNFDFIPGVNNTKDYMELVSTDFKATEDPDDFETYFDELYSYYSCRSGPLDPKFPIDGSFPGDQSWAWIRSIGERPGFPLEYTIDAEDLVGPPLDANITQAEAIRLQHEAAMSLHYLLADPDENDPPQTLWAHYTEHVCRLIERENKRFTFRHGWSLITDSARVNTPFNIAMPNVP